MFDSYFKITLRKLYREKLYALINVTGLSAGIACCLILGLYLRSELTYDLYNVNHDRIYRVVEEFDNKGQLDAFAPTGASLGPMLANDFNEIKAYVRFQRIPSLLIRHDDDAYFWDRAYYADANVFDVFTFKVLYGDPATALIDGNSVAVSETFARKYFGDINPVGKIIRTENGDPLTIRLVFADLPENTHLKYDILFSFNRPGLEVPDNIVMRRNLLWHTPDYTYLVMPKNYDVNDFKEISKKFYKRNMAAQGDAQGMSMRFWLEPLADIHLHSHLQRDQPTGNLAYLYAFATVALFIIIIACINYTNLTTARYMRRAKEVGLRKILGANRSTLAFQFLVEALVFSLIAMVMGIIIVEVVLKLTPVNQLLDKTLQLQIFDDPQLIVWLLAFSLVIGLLSGIYPALYLSSWSPLSALVGGRHSGSGIMRLRQFLVLIQFTISIAVLACTLLMGGQMRYLSNKPLGFNKENKIVIRMVGVDLLKKIPVIKSELLKHSHILGITTSSAVLGRMMDFAALPVENRDGVTEEDTIVFTQVDPDFIKTMGIKVVEGRDLNQRLLTDVGRNVLVNQALVKRMGQTAGQTHRRRPGCWSCGRL